MQSPSFGDLEQSGWSARADAYDDYFARITRQSIDAILDIFGDLRDKNLLDVACGTGHLTGAAAARGARADGIDFAATMLARAAGNHPECTFTEANADDLPFDDESFDGVACSYGMLHFEDPDTAVSEAIRVLRPGGRYAFTVWRSPEQGGEMFALVMGAVARRGRLEVGLPPAPPMFRFADPGECRRVLEAAGFSKIETRILPLEWRGPSPEALLEMIYKSVVRMPMILERQSESARERIHADILEGAAARRERDTVVIRFPALLATARRPA